MNTNVNNDNIHNNNPTSPTMSINNIISPSNANTNNTNHNMNNNTNIGTNATNPMTSPPRRLSNSPQFLDPLATPRSFLRNISSSATPSLIATPPPPFKYPQTLTSSQNNKDNNQNANLSGNADNIFAGSPMLTNSPYYDARTSMASTLSSSVVNLKLDDKLRYWRQDAYLKNLYETAAFWGNKVMTITGDSNDIYWLAQIYYNMGQYVRAQKLIWKLMDTSVTCRFLAAKCCEKYQEALELLGEENPFTDDYRLEVKNTEGGIQLEASMCYLRGYAFSQQANLDCAKKCFKEALESDVKCYEAFHELIGNHMMTANEEWDFITKLKYDEQLDREEAEFVKMNYISMLNKYDHLTEIKAARHELESWRLSNNVDVLLSHADELYTQCRFKECFEITSKVLEFDTHNPDCLPIHIVCLHELREKNKLFLLAHELVEHSPDMPVTWFGVGCYNYLVGKNDEARRYFSKASTMDSHFGPAWIGFGHSFAVESEHDQAITAYSTAAKLYEGSHIPSLFIGMQHLQANNILSADEYLSTSSKLCEGDPLVYNELGVMFYQKSKYADAIDNFRRALILVDETKCRPQIWETTWMNLGHAFKRMGQVDLDAAINYFQKVTTMTTPSPSALTAIGYCYHVKEEYEEAILYYHESLGIRPVDPVTQDLLERCLEEMILFVNEEKENERV
ncbi:7826_t:CDS:10 [Funneliformis geosporum]|nr:7826_t:CDS:10 [Funneliformis geosporum]